MSSYGPLAWYCHRMASTGSRGGARPRSTNVPLLRVWMRLLMWYRPSSRYTTACMRFSW